MVKHPFMRKSPYLETAEETKESSDTAVSENTSEREELKKQSSSELVAKKPEAKALGHIETVKKKQPLIRRIKQKIALLADDTWLDAMAERPRIKKFIQWTDDITELMLNREYQGENPAVTAARAPIVVGLWFFLFVFVVLLGWAAFAPLSSAAVASGAVVLDTNKKIIQHLEGGIIEEILVREGQFVKEGEPLVRLNETTAKARKDILLNQWRAAKAAEARLVAERDGKEEMEFPEELLKDSGNPEVANLLASQSQLFETRTNTYRGQVDVLNQRVKQLKDEIRGFEAQQKAAKDQIKLIEEEVATVEALVAKGQALKPRLLALKRGAAELSGQRGEYLASIARTKQAIGENELEVINLKNKYLSEVVGQLRETQDTLADIQERMSASDDILNRIVISAPQSGIVTGLQVHTKGGVIQPGAPIMYIVPQDERLIIESQVNPQDIDVVHKGLHARVRLSAYKAREVPIIEGQVETVSADRFVDQTSGRAYYVARVVINEGELENLKNVELYPGMPADVLIITGERTLLSYLVTPLTQGLFKAFREE